MGYRQRRQLPQFCEEVSRFSHSVLPQDGLRLILVSLTEGDQPCFALSLPQLRFWC